MLRDEDRAASAAKRFLLRARVPLGTNGNDSAENDSAENDSAENDAAENDAAEPFGASGEPRHSQHFSCSRDTPWLEYASIEIASLIEANVAGDLCSHTVQELLDRLATRVLDRVKSDSPRAKYAHLHRVMFDEERFFGDLDCYDLLDNHFVASALKRRRGRQITLSLLYKFVADRIGLKVSGLNTPGHFLVLIEDEFGHLVVDPFAGGRVLSVKEAVQKLTEATNADFDLVASTFRPISHLQWFERSLYSIREGLTRAKEFEKDLIVAKVIEQLEQAPG